MHYFFKQHEKNFEEWRNSGYQGIPDAGVDFLKHLGSWNFKPDLKIVKFWNEEQWKKVQLEAIERCIYSFEVLGEKDLLTNIVTGGGKTTIIGALIAYMIIVHNQYKFLILTPNTIVRERLVDEFDKNSKSYIYDVFPFFTNSHEHLKNRISLYVMKPRESATGVMSNNILLGNIHQIYERTENKKVLMENIEKRRIPARRYITSLKPMRQQIAIACELLKEQRMRTPEPYKPLLFLVTFSIDDAKNITVELKKIGEKYGIKKILLVHNETEEELKEAARDLNKDPQTEYDAVVSVLMLREGWDVRNISVVLLFRKFCYKEVDGQIFSVYGPQVIGRGLRRMSKDPEKWESLFIVDHPILKHSWLWDHLKATQYPDELDPANVIIDEKKIPEEKEAEKIDEGEVKLDEAEKKLEFQNLPSTPEPPKVAEPIYEWQKFLDELKYDFNRMNIIEDIDKIKSLNIDSDLTTLEKGNIPDIKVEKIAAITKTENWPIDELKKQLVKQIHSIARYSFLEYDRNPDERQAALVKIIKGHVKKRLLGGAELEDSRDEVLLRRLWAIIDQVRDVFLRPELIEGIFMRKK